MRLGLTLIFLCISLPILAAGNPLNFSNLPRGKTPSGFRASGGEAKEWRVIESEVPSTLDPSRPVKRHCLRHSGGTNNSERFPSLVFEGKNFENLVIKTSFRIDGGNGVRAAGIVIRAQPDNTSFVFAVIPAKSRMYLSYCEKGTKFGGHSSRISLPKDGWFHLELTCKNNTLSGKLNGENFETLRFINNPPGPGKVGFWARGDTDCLFTMSSVTLPVSLAQSVVNDIARTNKYLLRMELAAVRPGESAPEIAAATDLKQLGKPAHANCDQAIKKGAVVYSEGSDAVEVVMPVKNVDGEIMAAARMFLKPGKLTTKTRHRARAAAVAIELGKRIQTSAKLFR